MKWSEKLIPVVGLLIVFLVGCNTRDNNDKANVEEQNDERFESREKRKDAQFIVDAIDASYAIIEVAQLGEQKASSLPLKGHAKKIVEGQTSIINQLKTYAEDNDITVPFSGPSKTKASVNRLYNKDGEQFNEEWHDELEKLNKKLANDFEDYMDEADSSLKSVLTQSLNTLRSHEELLAEIDNENDENE